MRVLTSLLLVLLLNPAWARLGSLDDSTLDQDQANRHDDEAVKRKLLGHRKLFRASDPNERIDHQYIVLFKEGVDVKNKTAALAKELGDDNILFTYTEDVKGVALKNVGDDLLLRIVEDWEVDFAEEDKKLRAVVQQQNSPSWGLDRIDESGNDNKYQYKYTGKGVTVFVVDTGIRSDHDEFGGRVRCGHNEFPRLGCDDGQGHGTHIAGVVGGKTYGVAKDVDLVNIRVLSTDGTGTVSQAVNGLETIKTEKNRNRRKPMVANLSLGGESSNALDKAVKNVIAAGVVFVVAAGNEGKKACNASPAKVKTAITVGALNKNDRRPNFSNYGSCVDIFAPGSDIKSAWAKTSSATNVLTGTSMAAPFVAGVAAMYLEAHPSWTPAQVWEAMERDARRIQDKSSLGFGSPSLMVTVPMDVSNADDGRFDDPSDDPSDDSRDDPIHTPGGNKCGNFLASCTDNTACCGNVCLRFMGFCLY